MEIDKILNFTFEEESSTRLDVFLSNLKQENLYSRSYIDKLIKNNLVKVNDKNEKKSYKLINGDTITISIPKQKSAEILPQKIPLDVIYEDQFLAIINKQSGISVHPGAGIKDGTLVNALMHHFKGELSSGNDALRPGIVHRLDKDTSGLIIMAKDDKTHSLLSSMFQEQSIKKSYFAVLCGVPSEVEGTLETYIDRSKTDRTKMVVSAKGRKAITHYKILQDYHFFSTAQIDLETGRTHQIRVHFSHLNCPVLGDQTYNSLKRTLSLLNVQYHKKVKYLLAKHLQRQALHAHRLEFTHPVTKENVNVEAPIPDDIQYALNWLAKNFEV
ncbi:MAG: RluA family pseudouridine synthase [Candidatus Cloacimonetes bacterium]|nr:RluA family pseudouridine synthase [Candidatus Cloacimonadota bacterium]MCF7813532.1 RluA family pseudouridine synthase [Candidatus Cloacimonadota bacterium]MCF7868684.1 RluA family pseudouridine synthase [Candidatus Cloacimonadota bacterium]MCF7884186.1 RluA family pseudouridine synthase [Candidatus Cloacimonadota bacterium]